MATMQRMWLWRYLKNLENPRFQKVIRERSRRRKREEAEAMARKCAKKHRLCWYRLIIGINPPGYGSQSSCSTREFQAYGSAHARFIARQELASLCATGGRSGWQYNVVSFVRIVVREKTAVVNFRS